MSNKDNKILWGRTGATMLNLGHDNFVRADRVLSITESNALPMKRLREWAAKENRLIDATAGRKTKSMVITDSQHVFLSALSPHTLEVRLSGGEAHPNRAQLEIEEGEFVS